MAGPPIVDRLNTRLLERREVVRSFVKQARVLEADASGLLLETTALFQQHLTRWPAHAAANGPARELSQGEQRSGRLRIDALSDTILRVRYAEGEAVPANETPMVVGRFNGPGGPGRP